MSNVGPQIHMLIYFKKRLLHQLRPKALPYTKVGVFTPNGDVYFEQGRALKKAKLEALTSCPHEFRELPMDFKVSHLQCYFEDNHPSPELVQGILRAYVESCGSYLDQPIKLPKHDEIYAREHARRCQELASLAVERPVGLCKLGM